MAAETSTVEIDSNLKIKKLNQWVSRISNFDARSNENLNYLNSILGPIKSDPNVFTRLDNEILEEIAACTEASSSSSVTQHIIFKIDEKVFIESIDFYEKACEDSSLLKIEAKQVKPNKEEDWVVLYETDRPLPAQTSTQIFSPKLKSALFKSDTIRITISGNIRLIEAIEVKGNKYIVDDNENETKSPEKTDQFKDYCLLSKQLHSLILSDLFSDVIFEVEGKKVPAHRNILVSRSEYFRAMLSEHSAFKESKTPIGSPVYVGDITHEIFTQVLHFIYTGHVDLTNFPYYVAVELMRAADKMNLVELEKVCLFHLSLMINQDNAIKIYKETHDKNPIMQSVVQMCHDEMSAKFAYISRTSDFCSLSQELMIKIIENIVPKLSRVTSVQVDASIQPDTTPQLSNS